MFKELVINFYFTASDPQCNNYHESSFFKVVKTYRL